MGFFNLIANKKPVAPTTSFGAPHPGAHYTRRANVLGQGANVWSYDTLALPLYTPIGGGVPNKRYFNKLASSGVMYQTKGITITTLGSPGNLSGSFNSTPLLNIDAPSSELPMQGFRAGNFLIPNG